MKQKIKDEDLNSTVMSDIPECSRDEDLMRHALAEAQSALQAGEFPVGCVIADGDRLVASGVRKWSRGISANEIDHAEILSLKDLCERNPGIDPEGLSLYTTLEPCLMCFGAILISGIRRIVYAFEDVMGGGTACDLKVLPPLYSELSVAVVPGVLRKESLVLMKRFFTDPANVYLNNTLLAEHVLRQDIS